MIIKGFTVEEVKLVAYELAKAYMEWGEPIPEFETRFPQVLERCIEAPFQTFGGQLYKGIVKKGSILFYLIIKNHPFQNGNKRIAVTVLLVFLFKNKYWFKLDNQQLYNFAKWVASSDPAVKEETVLAIERMIKNHLFKIK